MTEIVLFHHVQGLTPGMVAFADELRAQSTRCTPRPVRGRTFPTLDEGMDYARSVGFGAILDRGVAVAEGLGPSSSTSAFRWGSCPPRSWPRPGRARAELLIDARVPVTEFADGWPDAVPVQVHGMDRDRSSPTRAT